MSETEIPLSPATGGRNPPRQPGEPSNIPPANPAPDPATPEE